VLKKKSPKALALIAWQDRYVRLTNQGLFYYRKKDTALNDFRGAIPLSCIDRVVVEPPGSKRRHRLDIHLHEQYNRHFSFVAKSDAEMIQWHAVLEQTLQDAREASEATKTTINAAIPAPGTGVPPGKIWKNVKEKEKKTTDKKDEPVEAPTSTRNRPQHQLEPQLRQQMERYIQLSKPLYPLMAPNPRQNMFESLKVLAQSLFGGYKIEVQEQSTELGSIFILGDSHYPMTHKSFVMHCAYANNPYYGQSLASMDLLNKCGSQFPLFPQQLHCGGTRDTVYSIYHPPLRSSHDSLFAWLPRIERFPEEVVAWIAAHIILTLDFLHTFNYHVVDQTLSQDQMSQQLPPIQFPALSPETVYFDKDGQVRVCDFFLNPQSLSLNEVPEYSCPEVICYEQQSTTKSDYWRLGVLLYELATGLPPFKPSSDLEDVNAIDGMASPELLESYKLDIKTQLFVYQNNPSSFSFPPFVSPELKSLILSLLTCNPNERLTDQTQLRQHPFFVKQTQLIHNNLTQAYIEQCGEAIAMEQPIPPIQLWDVYALINSPKLPWIQSNIISSLAKDSQTPVNLSFTQSPVPVQRLNCQIKRLRDLVFPNSRASLSKLVYSVTVEGDTQKNSKPIQVTGEVGKFDETITFDLLHGHDMSPASEIIIELHAPAVPPAVTSPVKDQKPPVATGTRLVGLVTFPLYEVRNLLHIESWLSIFDHNGSPIGEIECVFSWEQEEIPLSPQTLGELTDATKQFQELFGKPTPIPPRKLWASIIDISVLAQYESGASGQEDRVDNALPNHPMKLPHLNNQNSMNTIRGTMIGGTGRDTLSLPNNLSASRDLNGIFHPGSQSMGGSSLPEPLLMPGRLSTASTATGLGMSPTLSSHGGRPASFGLHSNIPTPSGSHQPFFNTPSSPSPNELPSLPSLPPIPLVPQTSMGYTGSEHHNAYSQPSSDPNQQQQQQLNNTLQRPVSYSTSSQFNHQRPPLHMAHSYAPENSLMSSSPHVYLNSTPSLPPAIPSIPSIPDLPPEIPALPPMIPDLPPEIPSVPELPPMVPDLPPAVPDLPPAVPAVPDLPPAVPDVPPVVYAPQPQPVPVAQVPVSPPVDAPHPDTVLKNWRRAKAPDGSTYYYNKVTKNTTWDPPACMLYVE
jgi:hypothetical protein